jgi:SAM-dependent methyltransferase
MIRYTHCPVCKSNSIEAALKAKDHTVSKEEFSIWHCDDCTLRFTQDVPDQAGIGAYYESADYISHSDTKKGIINNLYHLVRKHTMASKQQLVRSVTGIHKGEILDIGCGTGAFLNTMKKSGWAITGLEPDAAARVKAAELYNIKPLEPQKLFELPPAAYHAITMWHVLEHVHQLHEYLDQISKLLVENGRLLVAVPNYTSKDAGIYKEHWAAWDVPRHLYHFSPQSMEKLVSLHGLKLAGVIPMWFDSFYVSMLSEKYKNDKGNIVKAFFHGLLSNLSALGDSRKCSSVIYIIGKEE